MTNDNESPTKNKADFLKELIALINKYSLENRSNTPDLILGNYLMHCLNAYNHAVRNRDDWYSFKPWEVDASTQVTEVVATDSQSVTEATPSRPTNPISTTEHER